MHSIAIAIPSMNNYIINLILLCRFVLFREKRTTKNKFDLFFPLQLYLGLKYGVGRNEMVFYWLASIHFFRSFYSPALLIAFYIRFRIGILVPRCASLLCRIHLPTECLIKIHLKIKANKKNCNRHI